jgi:hypothetical protein
VQVKHVRIVGDWQNELQYYEPNFSRRGNEKLKTNNCSDEEWNAINKHIFQHLKTGVVRNSRGWVNPELMPTLEKLRNLFGLDQIQLLILRYLPGESNLYHVDNFPRHDLHERPDVELDQSQLSDWSNTQMVRLLMTLEDRKPGQYMQTGDIMRNNWKAGDVFYYDGHTIFHSAGNAGTEPRMVLRISGIPTPAFEDFLNKGVHYL